MAWLEALIFYVISTACVIAGLLYIKGGENERRRNPHNESGDEELNRPHEQGAERAIRDKQSSEAISRIKREIVYRNRTFGNYSGEEHGEPREDER